MSRHILPQQHAVRQTAKVADCSPDPLTGLIIRIRPEILARHRFHVLVQQQTLPLHGFSKQGEVAIAQHKNLVPPLRGIQLILSDKGVDETHVVIELDDGSCCCIAIGAAETQRYTDGS